MISSKEFLRSIISFALFMQSLISERSISNFIALLPVFQYPINYVNSFEKESASLCASANFNLIFGGADVVNIDRPFLK